MAIFNEFPQTNFHELNLDWIINLINTLKNRVDGFDDDFNQFKIETKEDLENWLANYVISNPDIIKVLGYAMPEMYGAVGDGENDDTEAIQEAINSGLEVVFSKDYFITESLNLLPNSRLTFIGNSKILNTNNISILKLENGRRAVIKNPIIQSANRVGIGIDMIKCQDCSVIKPQIINTNVGLKIDGADAWSSSNFIEDPYISRFNIGIQITANSGKQSNNTNIIGGYIIDEVGRDLATAISIEAASDTTKCFGTAVEDCNIGFSNTSYGAKAFTLLGCRAENCTQYILRSTGLTNGAYIAGCNFDYNSSKVNVAAVWDQNIGGKNITTSYIKGSMLYYDEYNDRRAWFACGAGHDKNIEIGPRGGANSRLDLYGCTNQGVPTPYIKLGGPAGVLMDQQTFFVMRGDLSSGMVKLFKVKINDTTGELYTEPYN